jgi:hypothetical protein
MLNRSAVVIGHEPAFYGWLKTTGLTDETLGQRKEAEEVMEDIFEEIFRRELGAWQPDEQDWPDTADFELFTRWFTVDPISIVEDVGRGRVEKET